MANISDNLRALTAVKPGDGLNDIMTAARINAIQEILRDLAGGKAIVSGAGVRKRDVAGGVMLTADIPPVEGGGGASGPYPFDISFLPIDDDTQYAIIRPGTLNGIIAWNYSVQWPVWKTGFQYFLHLDVTMSGSPLSVTTVQLTLDETPPAGIPTTAGGPPTEWSYLLGVLIDSTWYRTIGNGSLVAFPVEAYRVSQSDPTPGTLPYDIYYTMSVENA